MELIKQLYNHPTLLDEFGAKRINRASIIMMLLFAPLFIIGLALAILTTNIPVLVQSGIWFVIVSLASLKLQNGSNSARKGMMIISVMNILGGILTISVGVDILVLGYSAGVVAGSAYVFFLMWGNNPIMRELSARRKQYSTSENIE